MMNRVLIALLVVISCCTMAHAQAVQLPTFDMFGVTTTVNVPDQGAAYLGGVDRQAMGSDSRGVPILGKIPGVGRLFRNRAIGQETSAKRAWVTATIIDFQEMDEAILQQAASQRGFTSGSAATDPRAKFVASNVDRGASRPLGVEAIRRQQQLAQAERDREALALIEKGKAAESAGKSGTAKIYYRIAAEQANDTLKGHIARHLQEMAAREKAEAIAAQERQVADRVVAAP